MTKEKFVKVIEIMGNFNEYCKNMYELGFDLVFANQACEDFICRLPELLLDESIGEEGVDLANWVNWYLYDSPDEKKVTIDGKEVVINTPEELYDLVINK